MAIDPVGYLIPPRLLAALLVFPILTTAFVLGGTFGGFLSGCCLLGLDCGVYLTNAHNAGRIVDVPGWLLKSLVFGVVTMVISFHSRFTAYSLACVSRS